MAIGFNVCKAACRHAHAPHGCLRAPRCRLFGAQCKVNPSTGRGGQLILMLNNSKTQLDVCNLHAGVLTGLFETDP